MNAKALANFLSLRGRWLESRFAARCFLLLAQPRVVTVDGVLPITIHRIGEHDELRAKLLASHVHGGRALQYRLTFKDVAEISEVVAAQQNDAVALADLWRRGSLLDTSVRTKTVSSLTSGKPSCLRLVIVPAFSASRRLVR
jgi:hypothetical protein